MTFEEYKQRAKADLDAVFEAGKAQGGGGGDDYYNTYWDEYQEKGKRYHWNNAFANKQWTDVTYNPKYPFTDDIRYAGSMFLNTTITDTLYPLNFANLLANANSVFQGAYKLKTVRTLTVAENTSMTSWFMNCTDLENIEFEGTIGQNIDIHWSTKLTAESYHSIITHWSKTASFTVTFPPYETVKSVYDAVYGANSYDALVAEYPNVTIVYS
jgi:hypothetical protein